MLCTVLRVRMWQRRHYGPARWGVAGCWRFVASAASRCVALSVPQLTTTFPNRCPQVYGMGLVLSALAAALCVGGLQGFSQIMAMGGGLAFVVGVLLDRGRDMWVSGRALCQCCVLRCGTLCGWTLATAAA